MTALTFRRLLLSALFLILLVGSARAQLVTGTGNFLLQGGTWSANQNPGAFGLNGSLVINQLATPTGLAVSHTGTSGATQYCYRVAAVDNTGTTLAATEVCDATGNASLATTPETATWNAVTGAVGYNVYGRSTGAELLMTPSPITALSFVDNGSVSPSGALPTVNSTGALQAKFLGVNTTPPTAFPFLAENDGNADNVVGAFQNNSAGASAITEFRVGQNVTTTNSDYVAFLYAFTAHQATLLGTAAATGGVVIQANALAPISLITNGASTPVINLKAEKAGGVSFQAVAVASLPTCNSTNYPNGGYLTINNNNAACAYAGTPTAGGTTFCPVFCDPNAAAWKIH